MNNNPYNNYIPNHGVINNNSIYNEKYVTDYLQQNIGKKVKIHASFCDSIEWRDTIFNGTIKDVGRDYLVLSNNNQNYIIWNIYIDYIII